MSVILSRQIVLPKMGTAASDLAEGSIVYINESGSPVPFYVAKHDYESGLNGTGRTLLVRKDCYDKRAFDSYSGTSGQVFAGSDIELWLNSTYLSLLDDNVKDAITSTKFYYTPGNNNFTMTTLERSVFLLSITELNPSISGSGPNDNAEGSALPIASVLKVGYCNGSACEQWTRTPGISGNGSVVSTDGYYNNRGVTNSAGSRPCCTLPSTAKFNPDTLEFVGV